MFVTIWLNNKIRHVDLVMHVYTNVHKDPLKMMKVGGLLDATNIIRMTLPPQIPLKPGGGGN